MRRSGGHPQTRGERDVAGQHLLGPPAQVLDRVLPLELSRIDHPDRHEHQALEMAGEGSEDVQHRVDPDPAVRADQHGGGRFLGIDRPEGLGRPRRRRMGEVAQLLVQLIELACLPRDSVAG